jgi:hypothetical protein
MVEWTTTMRVDFLKLPVGLPAFGIQHYQLSTPLVLRMEYAGINCETVCCHPGYREGKPWYDWVEVSDQEGRTDVIPAFKVRAQQ